MADSAGVGSLAIRNTSAVRPTRYQTPAAGGVRIARVVGNDEVRPSLSRRSASRMWSGSLRRWSDAVLEQRSWVLSTVVGCSQGHVDPSFVQAEAPYPRMVTQLTDPDRVDILGEVRCAAGELEVAERFVSTTG